MDFDADIKRIMETFGEEPLDPEFERLPNGGITHPFCHMPYFVPQIHAKLANDMLREKRRLRDRDFAEGNYWPYVMILTERPYRLQSLIEIKNRLTDREWWSLVADVWIDTEFPHQNYQLWHTIFNYVDRPKRIAFMDDDSYMAWCGMPLEIEVWRGYSIDLDEYDEGEAVSGFSWTYDKDRAEWFARRFASAHNQTPYVSHGRVSKEACMGILVGRNESEVVVRDPDDVWVTDIYEVEKK